MKEKDGKTLSRRNFLIGAGAAGAAAVIAGPAMASVRNCYTPPKWDQEHEIVIIGSGFAGLAAAIQAKKLGAKDVVVFEKMPVYGGNSAYNGGLFAVSGSPLQKEKGIKDSPEIMAADQIKSGRGIAYKELLIHVAKKLQQGTADGY